MKNKTQAIELILVCALLVGLAAGVWYVDRAGAGPQKPSVSPSAVRVEAQKEWDIYSHPSAKTYRFDPKSFATYRTERTSGTLKIVLPHGGSGVGDSNWEPNNYTVVHAAVGDEIRLGTETLKLEIIAAQPMADETLPLAEGSASRRPSAARRNRLLYHADGTPFAPGESGPAFVASMGGQGDSAQFSFFLKQSGAERISLIGSSVFDARTHWKLDMGSSIWTSSIPYFEAVTNLYLQHSTPVDLAFDLAWGEPEIIDQPAREGEKFVFSNGALSLLMLGGNGKTGFGSRFGRTFQGEETIEFDPGSGPSTRTYAVFSSDSTAKGARTISAIDDKGLIVPARGIGGSGRFNWFEFAIPVERIAKIRVENLPNTTRAIISLPELYGTPEFNRGVEDLQDVWIPYLTISSPWQLKSAVEGYLQMPIVEYRSGISSPGSSYSAGPGYPLSFSDIRAGDLLKTYEAGLQPHQLRVDEAKGEIQIIFNEPTWIETILSRFHIHL